MARVPYKKTLARIARSVPLQSRRQLLDAVLPAEVTDEALLEHAKKLKLRAPGNRHPYQTVLDEVCRILPKAEDFIRRATPTQRQSLGGVSMALLALTAHEGLDLLDLAVQWGQEVRQEQLASRRNQTKGAMDQDEVERTKRALRDLKGESLRMCGEIKKLLQKVAERDARLGLGDIRRSKPTVEQIAGELKRLGDLGEDLIDSDCKEVRARAYLFGLNRAAARGWRERADALRAAQQAYEEAEAEEAERQREKKASGAAEKASVQTEHELNRVMSQTVALLTLVVEGFESGNRVDRGVPRLNTNMVARALIRGGASKRSGRKRRRRTTLKMHVA